MRWWADAGFLRDSQGGLGCGIVLRLASALTMLKRNSIFERMRKPMQWRIAMGGVGLLAALLCGCHSNTHVDTLVQSTSNPSHTYRASVIVRQYYVDTKFDTSPTTYVLLDPYTVKPDYGNGADFKDSEIVMKPTQCGPLGLEWTDDSTLKVTCQKCGISLAAVGEHPTGMGPVRVEYEGFPETSSWETAPHSN